MPFKWVHQPSCSKLFSLLPTCVFFIFHLSSPVSPGKRLSLCGRLGGGWRRWRKIYKGPGFPSARWLQPHLAALHQGRDNHCDGPAAKERMVVRTGGGQLAVRDVCLCVSVLTGYMCVSLVTTNTTCLCNSYKRKVKRTMIRYSGTNCTNKLVLSITTHFLTQSPAAAEWNVFIELIFGHKPKCCTQKTMYSVRGGNMKWTPVKSEASSSWNHEKLQISYCKYHICHMCLLHFQAGMVSSCFCGTSGWSFQVHQLQVKIQWNEFYSCCAFYHSRGYDSH